MMVLMGVNVVDVVDVVVVSDYIVKFSLLAYVAVLHCCFCRSFLFIHLSFAFYLSSLLLSSINN